MKQYFFSILSKLSISRRWFSALLSLLINLLRFAFICTKRLSQSLFGRHSLACMIAFAAVSLLYFQFQPTPAGADPKGAINTQQFDDYIPEPVAYIANSPVQTANNSNSAVSKHTLLQNNQRSSNQSGILTGRTALLMNLWMLKDSYTRMKKINNYTALFYRQERINGEMLDGQLVQMKLRHQPFSVYMKWLSGPKGQEVLYVKGEHDEKMVVHPGGWKARLVPSIKLDPLGSTAMESSRHPITEAGLLNLMSKLITNRNKDLEQDQGALCRMLENEQLKGRACYCFILEYQDRSKLDKNYPYRKSILYIDKELMLPVHIRNYTWPTEEQQTAKNIDELTLIEQYSYSKIRLNQQLANKDFDKGNADYHFRR